MFSFFFFSVFEKQNLREACRGKTKEAPEWIPAEHHKRLEVNDDKMTDDPESMDNRMLSVTLSNADSVLCKALMPD